MKKVLLSIIIPHYNSPIKLRRMLESLSRYKDIQVIVVDDCSTEGLEEYNAVQEEYNFVQYYSNTMDNKSAGGARNVGLKYAEGQWILFGDADDYFASNMYDLIEPYFDSDCDVVFFFMDAILDDGTNVSSDRCAYYADMARRYQNKYQQCKKSILRKWKIAPIEREIRNNWVSPCAKMVRRDFLEKENIKFEVVKYGNDNLYSAQVGCKAKKIQVSNQVIYHVTESTGTLTRNDDPNMKVIRDEVRERCLMYISENEKKSLKLRAVIAQRLWALKNGEKL